METTPEVGMVPPQAEGAGDRVCETTQPHERSDKSPVNDQVASSSTQDEPSRELSNDATLYEIKDIPGKGKGLIARFDIPQGTRVICEKPLLTAHMLPPHEMELLLAAKLKALSRDQQRQFLGLHNSFRKGKEPFTGIYKTNAMTCDAALLVGGIFATICRLNHSCVANSHHNWNNKAGHSTIHATRLIKAGEEITIAYDDVGASEKRRALLKVVFGFDCTCAACSLPLRELRASDRRRLLIQHLFDTIDDDVLTTILNPKESLSKCRKLLQLLGEEFAGGGAEPRCADVYHKASLICSAHGDEARASVFAERASRTYVICEGEDSPETQKMKALSLKPSELANFGVYSKKWLTEMSMVPKGLGADAFEAWMFREGS